MGLPCFQFVSASFSQVRAAMSLGKGSHSKVLSPTRSTRVVPAQGSQQCDSKTSRNSTATVSKTIFLCRPDGLVPCQVGARCLFGQQRVAGRTIDIDNLHIWNLVLLRPFQLLFPTMRLMFLSWFKTWLQNIMLSGALIRKTKGQRLAFSSIGYSTA